MTEKPDSTENHAISLKVGLGFTAVFLVGLLSFWAGLSDRSRIGGAGKWQTTEAKVVDATMAEVFNPDPVTVRTMDGQTNTIRESAPSDESALGLDYQFTVDGVSYSGYDLWRRSNVLPMNEQINSAPKLVRVYYHPETPDLNSLTEEGEALRSTFVPIIFGLGMMVVPIAIAGLMVWIHKSDWEPTFSNDAPAGSVLLDDGTELEIRNEP